MAVVPGWCCKPVHHPPCRIHATEVQAHYREQDHEKGDGGGRVNALQERVLGLEVVSFVDSEEGFQCALDGFPVAVHRYAFVCYGELERNCLVRLGHGSAFTLDKLSHKSKDNL